MSEFLRNCWYMGAWSHEVTATPLARQMLGEGMMFYRTSSGEVAALHNRCPHRFASLAMGKVIDDTIQCPYHGLRFNSAGQCVLSPLEQKPPKAVKVRSFPVIERDNIVWFWAGDPQGADPGLLPDFSYLVDTERYKHVFGAMLIDAHYELETDNLMDLSHVEMLHPPFGGVLNPSSHYAAQREGDQVYSRWHSKKVNNPLVFEYGPYPTGGELVDQWLEMRWDAPASMRLEVTVIKSGGAREDGYMMPGAHIATPANNRQTHYFWSGSLHAEDAMPLDQLYASFVQTFDMEDKPVIEQVAREMDGETDLLAMKPLLLRADAGAILARRVLAELVRKEQQAATDMAAAE